MSFVACEYDRRLKEKYQQICESDDQFVDGYYGMMLILFYLGNYEFACMVIKDEEGEAEEVNLNVREIRNYELGHATF